ILDALGILGDPRSGGNPCRSHNGLRSPASRGGDSRPAHRSPDPPAEPARLRHGPPFIEAEGHRSLRLSLLAEASPARRSLTPDVERLPVRPAAAGEMDAPELR